MREESNLDEFIEARRRYSRSRADYHLGPFDYSALFAMLSSSYFLFGAPGLDGGPLFGNVPKEIPIGMGLVGSGWAILRLIYILGVRRRHNERSAKKVLRDLLDD